MFDAIAILFYIGYKISHFKILTCGKVKQSKDIDETKKSWKFEWQNGMKSLSDSLYICTYKTEIEVREMKTSRKRLKIFKP